jgi:nucleoside-diphosphate-sugar epimerase
MQKTLVTGANGFIGSEIVRKLQKNSEVTCLVRSNSNLWRIDGLPGVKIEKLEPCDWSRFVKDGNFDSEYQN